MNFKNRDIISMKDFSMEEILYILERSKEMEEDRHYELLRNRIVGALFFEPSTRTRLSFESATYRLGGNPIGFSSGKGTSIEKGETLRDTLRTVQGYCDLIVMRHPDTGSAKIAADRVNIPVINGGDGPNEHPTQAFLDMYTIQKEKGRLEGLNIAMLGDLKYGRTVHSLSYGLSNFNNKLYFISPDEFKMPEDVTNYLRTKGIEVIESNDLEEHLGSFDVIYNTRNQKRRWTEEELSTYGDSPGFYILNNKTIPELKQDSIIIHPGPRNEEINPELDNTRFAKYFDQSDNGIPVRKALLSLVTGAIE